MLIGWIIISALILWFWSGWKKIPIGWRGLLLFLGSRRKMEFKEGWNCVPWPWDIKAVDCRKVVVKLDDLEAITADNTQVSVNGSFVRQIDNLETYFSVDEKEIARGLDDARDQEIRCRVRLYNLEDLLGKESVVAKGAQDSMAAVALKEWGIKVSELLIASFTPDQKVKDDLELEKRERLQRKGQRVQATNLAELINFFKGTVPMEAGGPPGPGLPPDQAYEAALIQIDKTSQKEISSRTFGLDAGTVQAIVAAVKRGKK